MMIGVGRRRIRTTVAASDAEEVIQSLQQIQGLGKIPQYIHPVRVFDGEIVDSLNRLLCMIRISAIRNRWFHRFSGEACDCSWIDALLQSGFLGARDAEDEMPPQFFGSGDLYRVQVRSAQPELIGFGAVTRASGNNFYLPVFCALVFLRFYSSYWSDGFLQTQRISCVDRIRPRIGIIPACLQRGVAANPASKGWM